MVMHVSELPEEETKILDVTTAQKVPFTVAQIKGNRIGFRMSKVMQKALIGKEVKFDYSIQSDDGTVAEVIRAADGVQKGLIGRSIDIGNLLEFLELNPSFEIAVLIRKSEVE